MNNLQRLSTCRVLSIQLKGLLKFQVDRVTSQFESFVEKNKMAEAQTFLFFDMQMADSVPIFGRAGVRC
jgi:hypothetical protein